MCEFHYSFNIVSEKNRSMYFVPPFVVNENFDNPSYNGGWEMILTL
jgi:hypothetical protein